MEIKKAAKTGDKQVGTFENDNLFKKHYSESLLSDRFIQDKSLINIKVSIVIIEFERFRLAPFLQQFRLLEIQCIM